MQYCRCAALQPFLWDGSTAFRCISCSSKASSQPTSLPTHVGMLREEKIQQHF